MFYIVGYLFAGALVLFLTCMAVVAATDNIKEAQLNRQYLPDIDKNANIKISIDGGDKKYYRVVELATCINDKGKTKNQRFVKELNLHELTDIEISEKLLK